MNRIKYYWLYLFLLVFSCRNGDEPVTLVQVGEKILYEHQLHELLPPNLTKADSSLWAEDYITKWVRKQLFVQQAEANLTESQKDVREELEEYRQSLVSFRYKNEMVNQKMDTIVTHDQIMNYYNEHKDQFFLNQDILKAIYIKMPMEVAEPDVLRSLCNDPGKVSELDEYCISYAKRYDKFDDNWVVAKLVFENIPEEIKDPESFLRRNKFIETKDRDYYYLVCIRDFRFIGQPAPIDYVESQVKNLILNARKSEFLKKLEEDVYQDGIEKKRVKIFYK